MTPDDESDLAELQQILSDWQMAKRALKRCLFRWLLFKRKG